MDWLSSPSFRNIILLSALIRLVLILYSEWHDAHSVVKYTDVDYRVFTDAARFLLRPTPAFINEYGHQIPENIAQGILGKKLGLGDPYYRATYRYTPLLALIMIPNITVHPSFGKYLFSACDIIVGILIYKLLLSSVLPNNKSTSGSESRERQATLYAALHLLNPMVFSISTRGSSEAILGALVIGTLYFAMYPRKSQFSYDLTAILLGIATHWKIYPLIYGVSIVAVMSAEKSRESTCGKPVSIGRWARGLVSVQTVRFAILSASVFMLLNIIMYLFWGYPFLYETYLYHAHRLDHKHNFSPYWFPIYLTYPDPGYAHLSPPNPPLWQKFARSPFASFVPQMMLSLGSGLKFGRGGSRHLPFTWFIQTALFVTFNKVCTSQYFLWYLTILPLVLPSLEFTRTKAITMIAAWVVAQALWLKFAYDLEFLGMNVYIYVWVCSILFLFVNCWEIFEIMGAYKWSEQGTHKITSTSGQGSEKPEYTETKKYI